MTDPTPVDDFEEKLKAEYGKWKAKAEIFLNGVRAFNPGDPVPHSHVEQYHYDEQGLVVPADSDEQPQPAGDLLAPPSATEPTPEVPAASPVPTETPSEG